MRRSARRFGLHDIRIYGVDHPAIRRAFDENPQIKEVRRGAGNWIWKPYILLDTLDSVAEGTVIIYTDAGMRYVGDPTPLFDLAQRNEIVLFHQRSGNLQGSWTKRDCFVLMQADLPEYWEAVQLDASIQIYRAGAKAKRFLLELREAMRDPRILCDGPNICGLPNLEGFRDHRHDQSVATILAIKHGIETFPAPKIILLRDPVSGARRAGSPPQSTRAIFEHHRRKNEPLTIFWLRLVGDYLGLA